MDCKGIRLSAMCRQVDPEFLERLKAGDHVAWDIVIRVTEKKIQSVIFNFSHNSELIEELTQQTFFNAFRAIHGFRGHCSVLRWLTIIARRVWLDWLRHRYKDNSIKVTIENDPSIQFQLFPLEDLGPLGRIDEKQKRHALLKMVERLPPAQADVMRLRINGDTNRQVAVKLGYTQQQTRSYYRSAMKKLFGMVQTRDSIGGDSLRKGEVDGS